MDINKMEIIKYIAIITVVFLLGFFVGRSRVNDCKEISESEFIKIEYNDIYGISNHDNVYLDSANFELFHYVSNYFDVKESKLPDYYITFSNDTIQYNKENFFYYYSLYEITKNISNGKGLIIFRFIKNSTDSIN